MRITSAETVELRAYMRWMPRAPIVAKKQRSPPPLASIAANCYRERDANPATIPLPAETPVPEVGKHVKCSACGSRKIDARPELYPGGVAAMRQRLRDKPIT